MHYMWNSRLTRQHLVVVFTPYMTPYIAGKGFRSFGDCGTRSRYHYVARIRIFVGLTLPFETKH